MRALADRGEAALVPASWHCMAVAAICLEREGCAEGRPISPAAHSLTPLSTPAPGPTRHAMLGLPHTHPSLRPIALHSTPPALLTRAIGTAKQVASQAEAHTAAAAPAPGPCDQRKDTWEASVGLRESCTRWPAPCRHPARPRWGLRGCAAGNPPPHAALGVHKQSRGAQEASSHAHLPLLAGHPRTTRSRAAAAGTGAAPRAQEAAVPAARRPLHG